MKNKKSENQKTRNFLKKKKINVKKSKKIQKFFCLAFE